MSEYDFKDLKSRYESGLGLEEISYNEAHNIIYGAIGFAEDGGIQPAKDFRVARYILEEDTDDIPLIEYDFGNNGKHFLVINRDKREMPYFHQLKKTLGDDFEFVMNCNDDEYNDLDDDVDALSEGLTADGLKQAMDNWQKMMGGEIKTSS